MSAMFSDGAKEVQKSVMRAAELSSAALQVRRLAHSRLREARSLFENCFGTRGKRKGEGEEWGRVGEGRKESGGEVK